MPKKETKKNLHKANRLSLFLDNNDPRILKSVDELGKLIFLNRRKQNTVLKVLLFNLVLSNNERLITPRAKTSFGAKRYNKHQIGYRSFITVLDKLVKYEYVIQEIGYKDVVADKSATTTITQTPKLRKFFRLNNWYDNDSWLYQEPELILLRKNNRNELVDYKDNKHSNWLRKELTKYNELLEDTSICLTKKHKKTGAINIVEEYYDLVLKRKFIEHDIDEYRGVILAFGGRMFGPWCNLNSMQRRMITINDKETVELDLQASSVNVLYKTQTGERYPDGDAYELVIDDYTIPRHIVKQASTIMFSTKSISSAVNALENHYLPYIEDLSKDKRSKKEIKKSKEYQSFKLKVKPSTMMNTFLEKHRTIKFFYLKSKRIGDLVACKESDMVFEIVSRLTNLGIPVLTVYDSFIVEKSHKETVQKLMDEMPLLRRK